MDDEELGQASAETAEAAVAAAAADESPALVIITRHNILAAPGTDLTTSDRRSLERIFQKLSPTSSTRLKAAHEGGS
ncbi:hypothetical protein M406DRAFT_322501 [Cryphonectria parasitica EP155]|uniref:Uncharacterized protein n=1 Tax=Cryphonectria parasitica (strain ATCC 38755 / EP155) TaxID=660469 RepID=A0A9P4XZF8_CRYP1|nr:uncharacterized protein M406DRAFT_322501 [Cryphonectria parasitica EP155]KAF3764169.1 hypothetical protein M406DRAFT_322501 [Cryphonectria parasitica EP155]